VRKKDRSNATLKHEANTNSRVNLPIRSKSSCSLSRSRSIFNPSASLASRIARLQNGQRPRRLQGRGELFWRNVSCGSLAMESWERPIDEWLALVCRRPRMFFEPITTTRDLIFFVRGFFAGAHPPFGKGIGDGFLTWLYERHGRTPPRQRNMVAHDFAKVLLEEYGDKPLFDVCEAIGDLFREYRALRPPDDGSTPSCPHHLKWPLVYHALHRIFDPLILGLRRRLASWNRKLDCPNGSDRPTPAEPPVSREASPWARPDETSATCDKTREASPVGSTITNRHHQNPVAHRILDSADSLKARLTVCRQINQ